MDGQLVIAFRGTWELNDIPADSQIAAGNIPAEQFRSAIDFMGDVQAAFNVPVTIVGHSLGGTLAQMLAAAYPEEVKEVVTFAAPGARELSTASVDTTGWSFYELQKLEQFSVNKDLFGTGQNVCNITPDVALSLISDWEKDIGPEIPLPLSSHSIAAIVEFLETLSPQAILALNNAKQALYDNYTLLVTGQTTVPEVIRDSLAGSFKIIGEGAVTGGPPEDSRRCFSLALEQGYTTPPPPPARYDPLVLDLDGNGIQTTPLAQASAYFDLDRDGFREKVEWFSSGDGILAMDRNGNGQIDDVDELFGDNVAAHPTGFSRLATYDTNADGLIDAGDAEFAGLQVWRDLNGNGVSEAGELSTLAEAGVGSISLNATGNTSTFAFADGRTGEVQDLSYALSRRMCLTA